jgi:hypothetical protein
VEEAVVLGDRELLIPLLPVALSPLCFPVLVGVFFKALDEGAEAIGFPCDSNLLFTLLNAEDDRF